VTVSARDIAGSLAAARHKAEAGAPLSTAVKAPAVLLLVTCIPALSLTLPAIWR
jgi:hypothetical protein